MSNLNPHPSAKQASVLPARRNVSRLNPMPRIGEVAAVYNQAGDDYAAYADGDPERLFDFEGLHGFADRQLWDLLEFKLIELRTSGRKSIRILDAGCGPGTWLRRLVARARALGFVQITARGFDIAQAQIERARSLSRNLCGQPGVALEFGVGDLSSRLPEADGSVDLTLCLYSVLSHLPVATLPRISAEVARVTSGYFVSTVRPVGSPPSVFVDSIEKARHFMLDNTCDRCEVELRDGRRFAMSFHLFTAPELRSYFAGDFEIEALRGLDLFHNQFTPDPRWNPALPSPTEGRLSEELSRIEEIYAASPDFIERAAHLLLVARRKAAREPTAREAPPDPMRLVA